jgi:CelD/BcsL family acetyltransferase involved in cellulose biosynthesis
VFGPIISWPPQDERDGQRPSQERPRSADGGTPLFWRRGRRPIHVRLASVHICDIGVDALVLATPSIRLAPDCLDLSALLAAAPGEVDAIVLDAYPTARRLPRLGQVGRAICYVPRQGPNFYVKLSGTFDQYLSGMSGKTRWTLKKKVRRLEEFSGGDLAFLTFLPPDAARFHAIAAPLAARTYQQAVINGTIPELDLFLAQVAAAESWRGYLLTHKGEPIAFMSCPAFDGTLRYEHVGYDMDYRRWSPGTVLLYRSIQAMFDERAFDFLDFTPGDDPHKQLFCTTEIDCATVTIFRPRARTLFALSLCVCFDTASVGVVSLLDRLGLKQGIKQAVRRLPSLKGRERASDS